MNGRIITKKRKKDNGNYHQPGERKYQGVADFLVFNLHDLWGLEIIDVIPACRVLKKGDAQEREDLLQRAWNAGQLF